MAGFDGIDRELDPGAPDINPYEADRRLLPNSLERALDSLEVEGNIFRDAFGEAFVNYILSIKRVEVARYNSFVTDWEHREYFEVY